MREFLCRLGYPDGTIKIEVLRAENAEKLKKSLSERGIYVFSCERKIGLFKKAKEKIQTDVFLIFNQELAALLKAGLPLLQCLEILSERQKNLFFKRILYEIIDKIKAGSSLSEAFESYGELFPKLYCTTLKSGERSGELEIVIRRFIQYQKLIRMVSQKIKQALVYPAILVTLSLILITIMMTYVIPKFTSLYGEMEAKLPILTRIVLYISYFIIKYFPFLLGVLVVLGILFFTWKETFEGRKKIDQILLKIPFIGSIIHLFAISQFTRAFGTLVGGGTPAVQALEVSANSISNLYFSDKIKGIISKVREGEPIWSSLETTGKIPSVTIEMIKVGEATGALDEMLFFASEFIDEDISIKLGRLMTLIEPIILIFMACIVAVLLASVYLPIVYLIGQYR